MTMRRDREGREDREGNEGMRPCFEIQSSPEFGLGLYARRDIAEGEVVLEELPFATTVAAEHDMNCCVECLWYSNSGRDEATGPAEKNVSDKDLEEGFSRCQGCHVSTFCSSCQSGPGTTNTTRNSKSTRSSDPSRSTGRHPSVLCSAYGVLRSLGLSEEDKDDVRFLLSLLCIRDQRLPLDPRLLSLWQEFYTGTAQCAQARDGTGRAPLPQESRVAGSPGHRVEADGSLERQGSKDSVRVEEASETTRPSKRMRTASPESASSGIPPFEVASSGVTCQQIESTQILPSEIASSGPGRGCAAGAPKGSDRTQNGVPLAQGAVEAAGGPSTHKNKGSSYENKGPSPPSHLWALVDSLDKDPHLMLATEGPRCQRIHQALVACMAEGPGAHRWGTTPAPSLEATAALLSSHERNTFAIMAPHGSTTEMEVRAFAMYPTASLFNHCCYPNLCRFDYLHGPGDERNAALQLRAMRHIRRGEQLFISYFPLGWPLPQRQQRLGSEYGFKCACPRCALEERLRVWEAHEDEDGDEEEEEEEEEEEKVEEEEEEEEEEGGEGNARQGGRGTAGRGGKHESAGGASEGSEAHGRVKGGVPVTAVQGEVNGTARAGEEPGRANGTVQSTEGHGRGEGGGGREGHGRGEGGIAGWKDADEDEEGLEASAEDADGGKAGVDGAAEDLGEGEGELAHAMYFSKHLCALEGCRGTVCACAPSSGTTTVPSTSCTITVLSTNGTNGGAAASVSPAMKATTASATTTGGPKSGPTVAEVDQGPAAPEKQGALDPLEESTEEGCMVSIMEQEVMGTLSDYYECNACGKIWTRAEWGRHIAESFHE